MDEYSFLFLLDRAVREINENNEQGDDSIMTAINTVIELADLVRKEGLIALEGAMRDADDNAAPLMPFLRSLAALVGDGNDAEIVRQIGLYRIVSSRACGYEALIRLLYLEGMLLVQDRENPLVIRMRLLAMLPDSIAKLYKDRYIKEDNTDKYEFFVWLSVPKSNDFNDTDE